MRYLKKLIFLYKEGLKHQTKTSRLLWILVAVKLLIMFGVLKLFFFPNYLNTKFDTDQEKSEYVSKILTNQKIDDNE